MTTHSMVINCFLAVVKSTPYMSWIVSNTSCLHQFVFFWINSASYADFSWKSFPDSRCKWLFTCYSKIWWCIIKHIWWEFNWRQDMHKYSSKCKQNFWQFARTTCISDAYCLSFNRYFIYSFDNLNAFYFYFDCYFFTLQLKSWGHLWQAWKFTWSLTVSELV